MIPMTLGDVAAAVGAVCHSCEKGFSHEGFSYERSPVVIRRVTTDSREVQPGDLFFALRGPIYDGHDFTGEAFGKGAVACVCDHRVGQGSKTPPAFQGSDEPTEGQTSRPRTEGPGGSEGWGENGDAAKAPHPRNQSQERKRPVRRAGTSPVFCNL